MEGAGRWRGRRVAVLRPWEVGGTGLLGALERPSLRPVEGLEAQPHQAWQGGRPLPAEQPVWAGGKPPEGLESPRL